MPIAAATGRSPPVRRNSTTRSTRRFSQSGAAAGLPATPDYNGAQQEGFCRSQSTIRNGRRCSAAVAYLRPALARPNLVVEVGALATRVIIEAHRAVGVAYDKNGASATVRAEREVILSGGSINSPQLLMLSGIGDPAELKQHGIPVAVALPAVGKNLQDHITADVDFLRTEPGPLHHALRYDRTALALGQAHFLRHGHVRERAQQRHGLSEGRCRTPPSPTCRCCFASHR